MGETTNETQVFNRDDETPLYETPAESAAGEASDEKPFFRTQEADSTKKSKVFIVDDEETTREVLKAFYLKAGYDAVAYSTPLEALTDLGEGSNARTSVCDLVICDLRMPEIDGLQFLDRVKKIVGHPPVILVTAHASVETAVEGLGKGAFDYITKPINFSEIAVISDRAIKVHRLEESYRSVRRELSRSWMLEDIVGKSPQMQRVFDFIRRVSPASCNVLINGESGTGKEMVARAIHARGPRAKKPFVAINCSAIPENLLESELFGHAKGSFTGATDKRRGLFEEAHEGTVFLDEIGDMPLPLQVKVLRFLQEKSIKPVGENVSKPLDVRIIAATHQNLKEAVREKKFREDLFYRLCVAPIEIPPLRQRKEDILLLAEHFLTKFSRKTHSKINGFTRVALAKLMKLHWPGNVRELENTIERAVVFCDGSVIDEQDIQVADISESALPTAELFSKLMSLEKLEKEYIEFVLVQTGNKREKAAEVLGINRKTLYRKQQIYGAGGASNVASGGSAGLTKGPIGDSASDEATA